MSRLPGKQIGYGCSTWWLIISIWQIHWSQHYQWLWCLADQTENWETTHDFCIIITKPLNSTAFEFQNLNTSFHIGHYWYLHMNIYECLWIFMNTKRYFMITHEYLWFIDSVFIILGSILYQFSNLHNNSKSQYFISIFFFIILNTYFD